MAYGFLKAGGLALTLAALGGAGTLVAAGCGSDTSSGVANAKLPEGMRSTTIEHEPCDDSSNKVEMLDANNDGKPDIKRVTKGGREICRITDLNHDGKPDMFEYYDETGQLRRREADYDDNGVVNSIEYYERGKLVRRELDTTNQGRIDTWDFFDPVAGSRIRRERDATGDGRIDQWWTYDKDRVTITMDRNSDGRPDPESTIVLGSNGQLMVDAGAPAAAAAAPPAPASPALAIPSASGAAEPTPSAQDAGVSGKAQGAGAKP